MKFMRKLLTARSFRPFAGRERIQESPEDESCSPFIRVKLSKGARTILMTIRNDFDPQDYVVVFADPRRLAPYLDEINCRCPGGASKTREAQLGIDEAVAPDFSILVHGNARALPMAKVDCRLFGGEPKISFTDGITRTTELSAQGAEFIPLEVPVQEAQLLHRAVGFSLQPVPASRFRLTF